MTEREGAHQMNDKDKEKIVGGPSARFAVKVPPAAHYDFGCYEGQPVRITRGLGREMPLSGTVLAEYQSHIVVVYQTPDGSTHTTSLTKASIICGDAIIRDEHGYTIHPRPKKEKGKGKKGQREEEPSLV